MTTTGEVIFSIVSDPSFRFKNIEEQTEIHERMCKCGHKFYMHAFTMSYDHYMQTSYYTPSQCISCTDYKNQKFNCEKFEEAI